MPKKFKGENSKAVEAKLRKNAVKEAEDEKRKQETEDEFWRDDNKSDVKKQQRKNDKEKKKQDTASKKKELKELYTDEMTNIKSTVKSAPPAKVTRAQIEETKTKEEALAVKGDKKKIESDTVIEENVNRMVVEGDEARNIEEAITILSVDGEKTDMHPEKRVKAAYMAFEAERLPQLKEENKNMKLSQLKHMLSKEWSKSPQNPLNYR